MPMTPKQMVKLLESNGFHRIRQSGSHIQFYNESTGKRTSLDLRSDPRHRIDERSGYNEVSLSCCIFK